MCEVFLLPGSVSFSDVKTLGSADDEDNSAASWVVRMKNLQEEKKKAEKKVMLNIPNTVNICLSMQECNTV